jgi:hypothetical protein
MVKRAILAILFFVLTTPVFAATECTTTGGYVGYCTERSNCTRSTADVAWDKTIAVCRALNTASVTYGCCGSETGSTVSKTARICDFAGDKSSDCEACMIDGTAAWTALGCIQTDPQKFIGQILGIAVGIGGGIAFLLILFGGFQILTSAGNPEKLNAGKELITSAITGLLIIIFSIFLLRLIGVDIFSIPEFK